MCKKNCSIQEDRNINPCQIEYKFFFFKKEKFNPWHSRSFWVWSHLSVVFPNKNQYNLVQEKGREIDRKKKKEKRKKKSGGFYVSLQEI